MDERRKIDCVSAADRDTLVMILARNGYAVRQAKEKRGTSKSYTHFVEYWKEGEKPLRGKEPSASPSS